MNEFLKFIVDNWVSLSSTIGMIVLWFSKRKYDKVEFKKGNIYCIRRNSKCL